MPREILTVASNGLQQSHPPSVLGPLLCFVWFYLALFGFLCWLFALCLLHVCWPKAAKMVEQQRQCERQMPTMARYGRV